MDEAERIKEEKPFKLRLPQSHHHRPDVTQAGQQTQPEAAAPLQVTAPGAVGQAARCEGSVQEAINTDQAARCEGSVQEAINTEKDPLVVLGFGGASIWIHKRGLAAAAMVAATTVAATYVVSHATKSHALATASGAVAGAISLLSIYMGNRRPTDKPIRGAVEQERHIRVKDIQVDDSSTLLTDASVSIEDLSGDENKSKPCPERYPETGLNDITPDSSANGLEQMLDTILGRLDETDVRLLLRVWSARTNKQGSPGMMKDIMRREYITTDDLGVVEKDMMAAGISFRLIVQDIPAVPDDLKYMRTAEVTVGPVGGEVEIPGFVKLSAARGILQEDTMVTITTVDIPSILRNPEGVNWISGYPWSLGEDTCSCPRELLDQVLFSPAVDINLHGAQLNGPIELQMWRPPGSEDMKCLLLKHHDGEGWTDITASTVHKIYPNKISVSLQTFSPLAVLWVPFALISVHVGTMIIAALSSRTSNCWFAGYIKPHEGCVEFHVVCRDRSIKKIEYQSGLSFTMCGRNKAMFDLHHGCRVNITVSLLQGNEKSKEMNLNAQQCREEDGQSVQMVLKRPKGTSLAGEVTIHYVEQQPPRTVCNFSFWEGDILTKTLPTKTVHPETAPSDDITPDSNANVDGRRTKTYGYHPKIFQPKAGPTSTDITSVSSANGSGSNRPVVLLINNGYGNSHDSVSTIGRQMAGFLVSKGAIVYSLVLCATNEDKEDAAADGVRLILPTTSKGDKRAPTLAWLTWDHLSRYPELPSDVSFVVGHVNITSHAARLIKEKRLPDAKLVQVTLEIPEDTSKYKDDARVLSIEEESAGILDDLQHADVIFSIGPHIYDYYKSQTRGVMTPHHEFLPKPSDIFSKLQVKHVATETKVVLSIGRVKGVEREKGYDLAAKTMNIVIEQLPNTKWRARGVSAEDFPESKAVIQANVKNDKFNFTPLKYATQKELSEDMQKADVVLMPSRAEPFGLVGLEAIAAGIPVLVSHKSGLAWFLKSQDPGFDRLIVEIPDDDDEAVKTLAKRVIAVLKNGSREFEASRRLKEKLLASEYWNESHRVFLEAFGL